ncbi:hypothetical protein PanWU01x14_019700 [Parasponia andersonii]|uniref:Uncharacterized protein n=1 Tax=Parasponia andersonii TaxID=3476 RepID=A0A2P5DYG9_PARAD|nr:hypothetical protein PanWU01x14_019700 [Parasponia andersonii]
MIELGLLEFISNIHRSQSEFVQNSDDVIHNVEENDNELDYDDTIDDYIEDEEELEVDDNDEADQDEHEDYIDSDND